MKKSFDSFDDWSGIITSTAGSFVTNTMGAFNSFDADGNLLNDKTFQTGTVGKLNSLGGGLVSSALSYGFTGETTFNVLNLADFGAGYNVGLFEVTLSKKNGISSRFGTGGLDVSASGIKTAYAGYKESSKIVDWKYGSLEQKSTLNAINLMGWSGSGAATKFSQDIWNGKINVKYEKLAYDENNKVYGYHDAKEGKTITLNSSLLGGGTEESAKLGAVMTHEGVHADGDRIEAHAHEAALDMYSRLTENLGLEGDDSFSQVMFDGICNPENLKENEGERDYWKLTKTGQLVSDGDGWLKDENGMYINADGMHTWKRKDNTIGAEKQESGLLNIMEGTSGQKYDSFSDEQKLHAQQLMNEAGLSMDSNGNWNNLKGKQLDMNNVMEYSGDKIAAPVFARYYDSTVDAKYAEEVLNPAILNDLHVKNINSTSAQYIYNLSRYNIEGGDKYIPETAQERFNELYNAKVGFYESAGALINYNEVKITEAYKAIPRNDDGSIDTTLYKNYNNLHYGIDMGRLKNTSVVDGKDVFAALSGKVDSLVLDKYSNGGYQVYINYGYTFKDTYITTGLYGEFDHLKNKPTITGNVNSNTIIGQVGNTGGHSKGSHLHYTMYSIPGTYYSNSTAKILLGNNYKSTAMTNSPGTKTVYDPTSFFNKNRR